MKTRLRCAAAAACLLAVVAALASRESADAARGPARAENQVVPDATMAPPLAFVENLGQWPEAVRFSAHRREMTAWLLADRMLVDLRTGRGKGGLVLSLVFEGAKAEVATEGGDQLPGTRNFFFGSDPAGWHSGAAAFGRVAYRALYEGIDLCVRNHAGRLEYDVLLEPGADLGQVLVRCEGADRLELEPDGTLVLVTAGGPISQRAPVTWSELASGERTPVPCRYRIIDLSQCAAAALVYYTFFGGSGLEGVPGILSLAAFESHSIGVAVDALGIITLGSATTSINLSVTANAFQSRLRGFFDGFIARFDPSQSPGAQLIYGSYLGGAFDDAISSVALDPLGRIAATGWTWSGDFPTSPGCFDSTPNGVPSADRDVFVALLDPAQPPVTQLVYVSYLGGSFRQGLNDLVLDANLGVYAAGNARSSDFPTTTGAFSTTFVGEIREGWVASLDFLPTGTARFGTATPGSNALAPVI